MLIRLRKKDRVPVSVFDRLYFAQTVL
jgi:hypothetical protein